MGRKTQTCQVCGKNKILEEFIASSSPFWVNGHINICYSCIKELVDYTDLNAVDRLLQFANIAFEPNEWVKIYNREQDNVFELYTRSRAMKNYLKYDWGEQNQRLIDKARTGVIDAEIDELAPEFYAKMRIKWGDFPDEQLRYLEQFYNEMLDDFSVSTATDRDLLKKFAITALKNEELLKMGELDKTVMQSYQEFYKMVQKSLGEAQEQEISSIGEIVGMIEKKGYQPHFYDGVPRDEIDFMLEDMQQFTKELVLGAVNIDSVYKAAERKYAEDNEVENDE